MFIVAILVFGMAIGWISQMLLGRARAAKDRNWLEAIAAGTAGSLVGGTLGSLLLGEGFQVRLGGIVASIAGAVMVLAVWYAVRARRVA